MCGYDPFYWYDKELDFYAQKEYCGCGDMTDDEYCDYLANEKAEYEIQAYEAKMGY